MTLIQKMTMFSRLVTGVFLSFLVLYLVLDLGFGVEAQLGHFLNNVDNIHIVLLSLLLIFVLIADILLPIPSSLVMITSGILLGGFAGGGISLIGSLLGSLVNFEVSRKLGRKKISGWMSEEEYKKLVALFRKRGSFLVVVSRVIPLVMETVNTIAGFSEMKRSKFLLYCLIGLTPISFLYSFSGALLQDSPAIYWVIVVGFFLPIIVWMFAQRALDRSV